jgi:hypothetical protein
MIILQRTHGWSFVHAAIVRLLRCTSIQLYGAVGWASIHASFIAPTSPSSSITITVVLNTMIHGLRHVVPYQLLQFNGTRSPTSVTN